MWHPSIISTRTIEDFPNLISGQKAGLITVNELEVGLYKGRGFAFEPGKVANQIDGIFEMTIKG